MQPKFLNNSRAYPLQNFFPKNNKMKKVLNLIKPRSLMDWHHQHLTLTETKKGLATFALFSLLALLPFSDLSAINITSIATGNWNAASTWDSGTIPTSADDVTIADGHTVTINSFVDAEFATLNIVGTGAGGTLTTINNADLLGTGGITNAGTINITQTGGGQTTNIESDITNTGTINWTGATLASTAGVTITSSGTFNFNPGGNTLTNIAIVNTGAMDRTAALFFTLPAGSNITNSAGGTFTLGTGSFLTFSGNFTNAGSMIIDGEANFNAGTFDLASGTMSGTGEVDINNNNTFTSDVTFGVVSVVHLSLIHI